jgi:hypothetical protein
VGCHREAAALTSEAEWRPQESVWTTGEGARDDGFMFYLKKMNLELYQKHWQHNRMWWQQLFDHHAQIVWDDYDKDYSDLPEPIMMEYKRNEARRDEERHLDHAEKEVRDRLQDKDVRLLPPFPASLRAAAWLVISFM